MWDVWVVDFASGLHYIEWSCVSSKRARKLARHWPEKRSTLLVVPFGFQPFRTSG